MASDERGTAGVFAAGGAESYGAPQGMIRVIDGRGTIWGGR